MKFHLPNVLKSEPASTERNRTVTSMKGFSSPNSKTLEYFQAWAGKFLLASCI